MFISHVNPEREAEKPLPHRYHTPPSSRERHELLGPRARLYLPWFPEHSSPEGSSKSTSRTTPLNAVSSALAMPALPRSILQVMLATVQIKHSVSYLITYFFLVGGSTSPTGSTPAYQEKTRSPRPMLTRRLPSRLK